MSKTNTTAWALLMVSDRAQVATLPDQEAWARTTAAEKGWTITETFSGVSGGKMPDLTSRMLERLEESPSDERPARILMARLECLGRGDGTEAVEAFLRLRELGVLVHTRLDGDVTYVRATEVLTPMVRLVVAGFENEIRQDKRRAKRRHQRGA